MTKPLLIGIGNPYRGDDAIGLLVAEALANHMAADLDTAYCRGNVMDLLDLWSDRQTVFLVDALNSETEKPGFVHHFQAHKEEIPAQVTQSSTHLLDIVQVIELAKALEQLPTELHLYGIEARQFALETSLSKELEDLLPSIGDTIENAIRKQINPRP